MTDRVARTIAIRTKPRFIEVPCERPREMHWFRSLDHAATHMEGSVKAIVAFRSHYYGDSQRRPRALK
jgi:hypothetical protein